MASEVSAPELFRPRLTTPGYTPAREAYLRENHFVDPSILAHALGLKPRFVFIYMRKLGLRACVPAGRKKD